MKTGKLALVLPTYRFDDVARHCLRTAVGLSGEDIEIFIGDNSCDPRKHAFLEDLAAGSPHVHVFCHATNIGADNWTFLINKTDHEFVGSLSDDDLFAPDYYKGALGILRQDPACSVAAGLYCFYIKNGAAADLRQAVSLDQSEPAERIKAYGQGMNAIWYGVYRSAALAPYMRYVAARRFFLPCYLDQLQSYFLLSHGTYRVDPHRPLFFYDCNNWSTDTAADNATDSLERSYEAVGLPKAFAVLNALSWTADTMHVFRSEFRPSNLTDADADAAFQPIWDWLLADIFTKQVRSKTEVEPICAHADGLMDLLTEIIEVQPHETSRFLGLYCDILAKISPPLAEKYRGFFGATLAPASGRRSFFGRLYAMVRDGDAQANRPPHSRT